MPCSLSCKLFYAPCIPQSHLHKRQKVDSEKVRAKIYYKEQFISKLRFTKKVTKFDFIFTLVCKFQMRGGDEAKFLRRLPFFENLNFKNQFTKPYQCLEINPNEMITNPVGFFSKVD